MLSMAFVTEAVADRQEAVSRVRSEAGIGRAIAKCIMVAFGDLDQVGRDDRGRWVSINGLLDPYSGFRCRPGHAHTSYDSIEQNRYRRNVRKALPLSRNPRRR